MNSVLATPINIGRLRVKNRIIMPAMNGNLPNENGAVTERFLRYIQRRAAGGVGLIILEGSRVAENVRNFSCQLNISEDKYISGLAEVVDVVHHYNCKIGIQLQHAGSEAGYGPKVSSSRVDPLEEDVHELTPEEINGVVQLFGQGARRAQMAGFDIIEIQSGHGYLVHQFLSPRLNKRRDQYGGSLENRAEFLFEIIESIRSRVGSDFPIIVRFSATDYFENGFGLDDGERLAHMVEECGIACVSVSAGYGRSAVWMISPTMFHEAPLIDLAKRIKKKVAIPVIVANKLTPAIATEIVEKGEADLVAFGRGMVADPDLPVKIIENRIEKIRPCIACNFCVQSSGILQRKLRCSVNVFSGNETVFPSGQSSTKKWVVVVGGGAAGMEAARVAAQRGHRVSLYEQSSQLGGQLCLAEKLPGKRRIGQYREWLIRQLTHSKVDIHLSTPIDPEALRLLRPDVIILATGAIPSVPKISGLEFGGRIMTAWDALQEKCVVGENMVIIGGGMKACEVALHMAMSGDFELNFGPVRDSDLDWPRLSYEVLRGGKRREVTIVEELDELAGGALPFYKEVLMAYLEAAGVKYYTQTTVSKITKNEVYLKKKSTTASLTFDTLLIACGVRPNTDITREQLADVTSEIYVVGDRRKPGKIEDAVHDGAWISAFL